MIKSGKTLKNSIFLSGNEALAQGAYEAGLKVAAAYPGTPSSEILEYLAGFNEIDSQWSVNEKAAFEVAFGAAIGGMRSLYVSKHVGVNVTMDGLMTSAYIGVNAGFVIVTSDDPGLHSSQNEQDNRLIARMANIPLLEPSSPAEAKVFIKKAFELSERLDVPVMLRLTTRISHTKENVVIGKRVEVPQKKFEINPKKYVMVPNNAFARHIDLKKRLQKAEKISQSTPLNKVEIRDKKLGIITSSVSYLYAREMLPDVSILKLGMSYPLPVQKIRDFAKKVKAVFVLEELEPFLEDAIKAAGIKIKAKHFSWQVGELRPEYIDAILKGKPRKVAKSLTRKPVMCPGCLHRPVFTVLRKLKAVVAGDIGCYTLGALPPLGSLHTCLCMGAGITMFDGLKRANVKNVVGVIGDSTFVHSGITGLINAVYNKQKGLVIILDNSIAAMTGGQPHPATGITIKKEKTHKLDLRQICIASGVDNVDEIDPFQFKQLEALIKRRMSQDSLSVIIARFPCRIISRKKAPRPLYIKENCKKCNICLSIDCPAITADSEGWIQINKDLCTGCNLCVEVCPFDSLRKNNG